MGTTMSLKEKPAELEMLASQAAALCVTNPALSYSEIGRMLKIDATKARRICLSKRFKELIAKASEDVFVKAKADAQNGLIKMIPEALEAIKQNIKDGNLNASIYVLNKGAGLEQKAEEKVMDTTLNVIMPGSAEAKTVENIVIEVPND